MINYKSNGVKLLLSYIIRDKCFKILSILNVDFGAKHLFEFNIVNELITLDLHRRPPYRRDYIGEESPDTTEKHSG